MNRLAENIDDPTLLKARLIWFGLFLSQVLMAVLAVFLVSPEPGAPAWWQRLGETVPPALLLAGVVQMTLALNIHRLLGKNYLDGSPERTLTLVILRMALLESVAVLGLITALVAKDPGFVLPFIATGAIGALASFPTRRFSQA